MTRSDQKGFTIIELLVATAVFSVVLLMITAGLMQIGRTYFRGINEARTHEVARTIIDDIAQSVRFSGSSSFGSTVLPANGSTVGRCIGSTLYSYKLGSKVSGSTHGLVASQLPSGTGCSSAGVTPQNFDGPSLASGSLELLGDKMRLAKFTVDPVGATTDLFRITVRVVYGDDDLLCSQTSAPAKCNNSQAMTAPELNGGLADLNCKNVRTGMEFCAVTELSTTVQKRL